HGRCERRADLAPGPPFPPKVGWAGTRSRSLGGCGGRAAGPAQGWVGGWARIEVWADLAAEPPFPPGVAGTGSSGPGVLRPAQPHRATDTVAAMPGTSHDDLHAEPAGVGGAVAEAHRRAVAHPGRGEGEHRGV